MTSLAVIQQKVVDKFIFYEVKKYVTIVKIEKSDSAKQHMNLSEKNKSFINQFLTKKFPNLYGVYLFGSYATGKATIQSDADIALLNDNRIDHQTLWDVSNELSEEINIEVDLIDLHQASTVLAMQVINQGCLIQVNKPAMIAHYENYIFSSYINFNERRKEVVTEFINDQKNWEKKSDD